MASALQPLLDRRLIVVSGKGGTGKTTVVAGLALAALERGLRVAVIETGRSARMPSLLGLSGPEPAYPGGELRPGLWGLRMEPYDALVEYLQSQLHVPGLVTRLLNQPAFHALLDAAPGWRELITMGKVWHLEQAEANGQREWDLLLIDSPATGHGLSLLDVPRVVVSAVRTGPLHRHVGWVEELVKDPARCVLLPVTLPEELPVRETLELVEKARNEVGIAVDRVVVNRCIEPPRLSEPDGALSRLEQWAQATGPASPAAAAGAHALRIQTLRAAQHAGACQELEQALGLPLWRLPELREPAEGEAQLTPLGRRLLSSENPR